MWVNTIVEQMFDALEVLISKDCAYCALVDPVLRYIISKGYVKLIQRREFLDKQAYIKDVETIAKKYQQKRSFPLILVHHAGKEAMIPSHVIDDIIDFMTSLDEHYEEEAVLRILVGELTYEELGDVLTQPASKLILGVVEALNEP